MLAGCQHLGCRGPATESLRVVAHGVHPVVLVSQWGGVVGSCPPVVELRVLKPALMTGSLPRCAGRRGRARVQLWPQGGAESLASQQYNPGWAQLFLETGEGGVPNPAGGCRPRRAHWGSVLPNKGLQTTPPNFGGSLPLKQLCILPPTMGYLSQMKGLCLL